MSVQVRNHAGEVVGELELDPRIFGAQVNVPLMHQVVRAQLAAARSGTHATKTRGDVSGGGKKPWRQKGTGRARQGSTRAPHFTGGGVVFGPHPRDHSFKVPKKMKVNALRSALSDRAREGKVAVVERFEFAEPKTQEALELLRSLGLTGKVLLVLEGPDHVVGKSFRNLPGIHILVVDQLNVYDVLNCDAVLFTKTAIDTLSANAVKASGESTIPTQHETTAPTQPQTEADVSEGSSEARADVIDAIGKDREEGVE